MAKGISGEDGRRTRVRTSKAPRVGRLNASAKGQRRLAELRSSAVLVATPDVIHAWLLSHVAEPAVFSLLRNLRLVVVDER